MSSTSCNLHWVDAGLYHTAGHLPSSGSQMGAFTGHWLNDCMTCCKSTLDSQLEEYILAKTSPSKYYFNFR